MHTNIRNFLRDKNGQDLVEYTLLLAFVVIASASLLVGGGDGVKGILGLTNSNLQAAQTAAS